MSIEKPDICRFLSFGNVQEICALQFDAGVCGMHDIQRINDEWHSALGQGKLSSKEATQATAEEFRDHYVAYLKTQ